MQCTCGCDVFERKGKGIYEDGYLVEYTTYCVSCGNDIVTWSYGTEFINEENVAFDDEIEEDEE